MVQQNIFDQKLETSRLVAKIRRLEAAQNVNISLAETKGIENEATFEKMKTMYQDIDMKYKEMERMTRDIGRMSTDMEKMHEDINTNHSLNTKSQRRDSIIEMGLTAEKQERIELSSKLKSHLINITETFITHKKETEKMVEHCNANINSLEDVFERDVNSTLFIIQEQVDMNHESVSSELVKIKQHLDKTDVMISKLDDTTFRSDFDAGWARWGTWSSCSVTCGSGVRDRTRTCKNPEPSPSGRPCEGKRRMIQVCNNNACPATLCIDDGTVGCARMDKLFDICQDLDQASLVCPKFCNLCLLVDGNWAQWSAWSNCDVTCGNGTQSRIRACTNPAPKFGGLNCDGSSSETRHCVKETCPNGAWSNWESWGSCSESCGGGVKSRLRTCTNPKPSILGKGCSGSSEQVVMCNKNTCVEHFILTVMHSSRIVCPLFKR